MNANKNTRYITLTCLVFPILYFAAGTTFQSECFAGQANANCQIQIESEMNKSSTSDYIGKAKITHKAKMYRDISNYFFPDGPILASLEVGQIVTLLDIYPNDSPSQFSYKIQIADGIIGYTTGDLELMGPLDDQGEMISLHLSDPYEYEGNIEGIDREILKYSAFLQQHPNSAYAPEAMLEIASLHLYVLQFPVTPELKLMRIKEMKNIYKRLFIELFKPEIIDKVNNQFDAVITEYEKSVFSSGKLDFDAYRKYYSFWSKLIRNVVPMSIKP